MADNNVPLVTIRCLVYNHEPFVKECLEGFVKQKTNFSFEAIIHDDASTDNSASIISEYANKYPEIIKPIIETENQYSKHDGSLRQIMDNATRGRYIAYCEGDDYWTDPLKLQKQIDFLEQNPEYSICFHPVKILKKGKLVKDYITRKVPETTDIYELAKGNYLHTLSVVFRRNSPEIPSWVSQCPAGDYALHMFNATFGKIKKLNDVMGVYRIHHTNTWVNQDIVNMSLNIIAYLEVMMEKFSDDINMLLKNRYASVCVHVSSIFFERKDIEKSTDYFRKAIEVDPKYIINSYFSVKHQNNLFRTYYNKIGPRIKLLFQRINSNS